MAVSASGDSETAATSASHAARAAGPRSRPSPHHHDWEAALAALAASRQHAMTCYRYAVCPPVLARATIEFDGCRLNFLSFALVHSWYWKVKIF